MSRAAALVTSLVALASCRETASRDAGPRTSSPVVPPPPPRPAVTRDAAAIAPPPPVAGGGPWLDQRLRGAASSQAVLHERRALSVVAVPAADRSHARISLVRWGPSGAELVAQRDGPALPPGASISLHARGEGWTAVWRCDGDGGDRWCAQDLAPEGFVGDGRAARPEERAAADWTRDLLRAPRRERASSLPDAVEGSSDAVTIDAARGASVVRVGGRELLRGDDLRSYAPGIASRSQGDRVWVALSRGRCERARVELWSLDAAGPALRASYPVRAEVEYRWMRVEAREGAVALSWYQAMIPVPVPCARTDAGARTADHGVRVALFLE